MALNFAIVYFGIVHSLIVVVELLVLSRITYFEKFTGKKNYLFFSSLVVGIGFVLLAIVENTYVAIALILAIGGFGLTRKVLFNSYYNKHIESKNRATVISTISMTQRFFQIFFNLLTGVLVAWSLNYTFIFLGALVLAAAIFSRVEEEHLID